MQRGGDPLSERHGHAVLFTTVEPCPLCLGAAVMADVPHIVFAHSRHIETYQGSVLRDESRALFER